MVVSFLLALSCHLLLLGHSMSVQDERPPQLISNSSISVNLDDPLPIQQKEVESEPALPPVENVAPPPPLPKESKKPEISSTYTKVIEIQKSREKRVLPAPVVKPVPIELTEKPPVSVFTKTEDNAVAESSLEDKPLKNSKPEKNKKSSKKPANPLSSVVEAQPLYQHNPKPRYPGLARRRGWQGIVRLDVDVNEDGDVAAVRLLQSCGFKLLDNSAIKTVKSWRFTPGTKEGKTSSSTVIIPIHFRLAN